MNMSMNIQPPGSNFRPFNVKIENPMHVILSYISMHVDTIIVL
jgi:hypothetical protein